MTDTPQTSLTTNSLDGLVESVFACKNITIDDEGEPVIDMNTAKARAMIEDFISRYTSGRAAV